MTKGRKALRERVTKYDGEGRERKQLEVLAQELKVQEKVIFCGEVKEHDLPDYYRLADIFLFLPREEMDDVEGFGLVALEASSCGVPVIAAESGGVPDAVRSGETGVLVQPDNIPEILMVMERILSQPDYAKELGEGGRIFAQSRPWSLFVETIAQQVAHFTGKH